MTYSTSKIPSERRLRFQQLEDMLIRAGYFAAPCHRKRYDVVALLFIAVSQLGASTGRHPREVVKNIGRIYTNIQHGSHFRPNRLAAIVGGWQLGREEGKKECCFMCGQPLPAPDREDNPLDPPHVD